MTRSVVRLWHEYAAAFAAFGQALRVASLRRVVIAFGAVSAVEAASWLAIGVYAYNRSGAAGVGLAGLAILLPCSAAAPIAAALADQFSRQRILATAYLCHVASIAATTFAIAVEAPPVIVWVSVAIASLAATPIRPAQGALLPSISIAPASLTAANVALTTVRNLGLLAGPLLAGLFLGLSGPAAVFAACVPPAALSAWLVARVPTDRGRFVARGSAAAYVTDGLRLFLREQRAMVVVALAFAKHVLMGAIRIFLVVIALGLLGMQSGGTGILSTALGFGGFMGAGTAVLSVERLAAQLEPMSFDAGAIVIRQGDAGERFYVIEGGAAEVDVDGVRVATFSAGASFGEIALLHDVPRTATVRTIAPSRILALDRHHFLSVLGDEPKSMFEAERVATDRWFATLAHDPHFHENAAPPPPSREPSD